MTNRAPKGLGQAMAVVFFLARIALREKSSSSQTPGTDRLPSSRQTAAPKLGAEQPVADRIEMHMLEQTIEQGEAAVQVAHHEIPSLKIGRQRTDR